MSNEYKPGEIVDIEIKGARVAKVYGTRVLVECSGFGVTLPSVAADGITVTRVAPVAPAVQAGDVWRMGNGDVRQIFMAGSFLEADDPRDSGYGIPAADLDFTGAELLFRLNAAPAAGMLRRFRDRDGDVWTETSPVSGRYHITPCGRGECDDARARTDAAADHGPLTDLESVPAAMEVTR